MSLIIPSTEVRLSAEQREQQRQEMARAIQFLLQRMQHVEHVTEEALKALESMISAVVKAQDAGEQYATRASRAIDDFTSMSFWQRLGWLFRGQ